MGTNSIYNEISTIEQQYKLCWTMQSLRGLTSESETTNKDKPTNSNAEETFLDKRVAPKYGIIECMYAIRCVQAILYELYNNNVTITSVVQALQSLVSSKVLQSPANNPRFLVKPHPKLFDFNTFSKIHCKTNSCSFCCWLGLPQSFYSSHIFKINQEYLCPLYPFHYSYTATLSDGINVIIEMAKYMNMYKFCEYCKRLGKPKQMYMSHTLSLSNGSVVCPVFEKGLEVMQRCMSVFPEEYAPGNSR